MRAVCGKPAPWKNSAAAYSPDFETACADGSQKSWRMHGAGGGWSGGLLVGIGGWIWSEFDGGENNLAKLDNGGEGESGELEILGVGGMVSWLWSRNRGNHPVRSWRY